MSSAMCKKTKAAELSHAPAGPMEVEAMDWREVARLPVAAMVRQATSAMAQRDPPPGKSLLPLP